MSVEGSVERSNNVPANTSNGNGVVAAIHSAHRLRSKPDTEHKPDEYDDLQLEFSPLLYSSLEPYLPPAMLNVSREDKLRYMREILYKYSPEGERNKLQKLKSYKRLIQAHYSAFYGVSFCKRLCSAKCMQKPAITGNIAISGAVLTTIESKELKAFIIAIFKGIFLGMAASRRLHRELYSFSMENFFLPSFVEAIKRNSEAGFRSVISEPTPGIFTFDMLQPRVCELLLDEVEHFERFVFDRKMKVMRPNTMNKYGAVVDDFGLDTTLGKLMEDFILPLSKVFFSDVGGSTLDSHHGFVVEYGIEKDVDLAFHVDDAEVTLNICLGREFSGGELFFRGVRCDKHVNTETHPEEIFDYSHVPGRAVLHRGRHRHGARATTAGHRINLLLWCRSSVFRELKKYQRDCSGWCGECQKEKKERLRLSVSSTKNELLKRDGESAA